MPRSRALIPLLAAAAVLMLSTTVSAAKRFATCAGTAENNRALCHYKVFPTDAAGAAFKDLQRANTAYRVCWTRPDGKRTCSAHTTGAKGKLSFVRIKAVSTLGAKAYGKWVVRWYLGRSELSVWRFSVVRAS